MIVSNILTDTEIKKATPRDKKYYLNDGCLIIVLYK